MISGTSPNQRIIKTKRPRYVHSSKCGPRANVNTVLERFPTFLFYPLFQRNDSFKMQPRLYSHPFNTHLVPTTCQALCQVLMTMRRWSQCGERQTGEPALTKRSVSGACKTWSSRHHPGVGIVLCLYNSKIASETTRIAFYLLLQTYIHLGTLQPVSIPSSLPKLAAPFPRSFWPPGTDEKLTLQLGRFWGEEWGMLDCGLDCVCCQLQPLPCCHPPPIGWGDAFCGELRGGNPPPNPVGVEGLLANEEPPTEQIKKTTKKGESEKEGNAILSSL